MSWRDSQRFLRIASVVRALGWALCALALAVGGVALFDTEGEDALLVVKLLAAWLTVVIAGSHIIAWMIEKHAERVVVR
jgi:hypothetical protein